MLCVIMIVSPAVSILYYVFSSDHSLWFSAYVVSFVYIYNSFDTRDHFGKNMSAKAMSINKYSSYDIRLQSV